MIWLCLSLWPHFAPVLVVTMCGHIGFLSVTETGLILISKFCTYSLCLDTFCDIRVWLVSGENSCVFLYSHTHSSYNARLVGVFPH